jgi:biopolymer transport protein ExbD
MITDRAEAMRAMCSSSTHEHTIMAETSTDVPLTRRRHRTPRAIRLDMTPLVDLAFLLLSFFVVTTTLRHEQVMSLAFSPPGPGRPNDNSLTFLIAHRNECYAYRGAFDKYTTHLQRLDRQQLGLLLSKVTDQEDAVCVLKPHATAKYGAVIDLIDELEANHIQRYAVHDSISADELAMLERKLSVVGH